MAPAKPQGTNGGMKQKSLMGWLSKPPATPLQSKDSKPTVTPKTDNSMDEGLSNKAKRLSTGSFSTPLKPTGRTLDESMKGLPSTSSVASAKSSSVASDPAGLKSTPPTSDPIDMAMQSDEEDEPLISLTRGKRKKVAADSDDEVTAKTNGKASSAALSSEAGMSSPSSRVRAKKPRVSMYESDDEDEEEDNQFTKRLSRFKKPALPKKSGRSSDAFASDSDFIPMDDSEAEAPALSSRRASSASGRSDIGSSMTEVDSASEFSDAPKKVKSTKNKTENKPSRPSIKKIGTGESGRSRGSSSFLTAAEQAALEKKSEKKEKEDPFDFLKDVRDKDKNRPEDPNYDPRTLYIPPSAWKSFTPFEKQFWEIKQNHYDTVLFFQKGKFLELYEDDARIGHQQFDLKLTERVKMSMVGVPESSFSFWAAKFLAKGYKVGRVDQSETALGAEMRLAADKGAKKAPQADKIVRRELNKVYTNGTLVDGELLSDEQAGHCVSIRELDPESDKGSFGICVLDTSTSEFNLSAFDDDACRTKLETMIRQLRVKELVFTKGNLSVSTTRLLKVVLPGSCLWTGLRECEGFRYKESLDELKKLYPDEDDVMEEGAGIPDAIRDMLTCKPAVEALGSMIWYLRQLNIDKDILSMKNFNIYDPMKRGQGLVLDGQTLAHVEVLQNNEGTDEGSLLKILGRCVTPFGKRLFRIWLCMPLREVSAINARLDAVQDLMDHPTFEGDFNTLVKGIPDLERIISRIHAKNCKVKDFLKVLSCFRKLSKGFESLSEVSDTFNSKGVSGLLRSAPDLVQYIKNIEDIFEKPESDSDELMPKSGKDKTYDEVMERISGLESSLEEDLKELEEQVGCKLSYWHSAVGTKDIYLVQTKAGQQKLPRNWTKSGGTKAYARWVVPELGQSIRKLKEAREERNTAIKEFKFRLFAEFDKDRDVWLRAVRVLAELDCLFSLAKSSVAIGEPACRPEFSEDAGECASLEFEDLRHPALCLRSDNFIPNDVKLGGDVGRVALLTGPNMGGKSTVMRMTAVGVIIAQLGMLVPAKRARLAPVDAILTRMGAYDNMFSNASTFKVELDECCKILREATPRSLVILDELGRGTSTFDGMAIAEAVLHQIATHTLPLCFFATHYGSLTDDFAYHPNIRNMHMSTIVDDEKCELVFLYKLVDGVASSSFGTHVANLAGVPMDVVKRAEVISTDFAKQFKERIEGNRTSTLPLVAQADFVFLLRLAKGEVQLPENKAKRRLILKCLKEAAPRYVQTIAIA